MVITLDSACGWEDKKNLRPPPARRLPKHCPYRMSESPRRPVVLLVEDSEDDVFFFRHVLKKTGQTCRMFHAADGAAAMDHLKAALLNPDDATHPWPDLVFLDLKLPTFSGFEILEWIRQQKLTRALDVAILSGSEHASDTERARALGAAAYFVKPISVDQLRSRLLLWTETPAALPVA